MLSLYKVWLYEKSKVSIINKNINTSLQRGIKMVQSLKQVLMRRDELTEQEADEQIAEMQQMVMEGENPEELLYDIGLEPDYVFDLL